MWMERSWKTIGFSPALAGKAGILLLGQVIINNGPLLDKNNLIKKQD